MRSLRRPLLTKVKMSVTFSMVSTSVRYCSAEHSLAEVGSENRIFHCLSTVLLQNSVDIETAQAKEMCCFYNERFTLFCCVHTYQQRGLRFVPPFLRNVLRYVRTRRNIVKPIYMRSCNRFHSYESPYPPSGRVGDVVAMLQVEFLGIGNHGITEAAGFQRGKGIFLAPQAIDSVEVLGTNGSIRFATDVSLRLHEVKDIVVVTLDRFPVFTDAVTLRKLKVVGSEPL